MQDGLGSAVKEGEHLLTVRNACYTVHHKQQGDIPILQVRVAWHHRGRGRGEIVGLIMIRTD
eukprot:COSAG01_NODE_6434_length_3669_cov_1.916527_3_plen_62_part_00